VSREWPALTGDDARVVRFTPRNRRHAPRTGGGGFDLEDCDSVVPSLAVYEQCEGDDEFRQRMTMNCIAFVVNLLLIIVGVWLADRITGSERSLMSAPAISPARLNANSEPLRQRNQPLERPLNRTEAEVPSIRDR
jgi:hypothetical protein